MADVVVPILNPTELYWTYDGRYTDESIIPLTDITWRLDISGQTAGTFSKVLPVVYKGNGSYTYLVKDLALVPDDYRLSLVAVLKDGTESAPSASAFIKIAPVVAKVPKAPLVFLAR